MRRTRAWRQGIDMLVVASNRLPVTVKKVAKQLALQPATGGVAVGLAGLRARGDVLWVGWPGQVPKGSREEVAVRLRREQGCEPVFLPKGTAELYYNGFCNGTLWPVFHSMPSRASFRAEDWRAYEEANRLFADRLEAVAGPNDTFWIQDFHLMLVPRLLRERRPTAKIGFFLHIPFPSFDTLRTIPWSRSLLEGLAGADLVGFHTYDYAQAYLGAVRRILGLDNTLGEVLAGRRAFQVDVFPMGIDFGRLANAASAPGAAVEAAKLRAGVGDRRVTLSISRLDYTKGIPELLDGIETFLETRPDWKRRFTHFLVVTPSRENVGEYRALKRQIDERVGRLNSRFGSLEWTPVRYIFRQIPFDQLVGLYACADVALITPARDGMNLMAKEYLAARSDLEGVLVLSEFAGAARELTEAILVNPNSREDIAAALGAALDMPAKERRRRAEAMRVRLAANDTAGWAQRFLDRLEQAHERAGTLEARQLSAPAREDLVDAFAAAKSSLLILDFDGTLVEFAAEPRAAKPDEELLGVLRLLAARPGVKLVILSGRDRATLGQWFANLPATLVAEHGASFRPARGGPWRRALEADASWKPAIRQVLKLFVDRIPGSSIEEKELSVVWHWRRADRTIGAEAARELIEALTAMTANTSVVVLPGHRVVEVKEAAAGKGPFYTNHLALEAQDFVLAVGDDLTDETLFRALPPSATSIRVGRAASAARYNVDGVEDVRALLAQMARVPARAAKAAASTT